jgi:phenylacetate-coenzyme A ligase PaaK-like adenylate-forming protein
MTTYNINFPIVDLSTPRYGNRVCFAADSIKVNPRNEMGKFGIRTHSDLTRLFHQTIKITGKNHDEKYEKSFYLNKKSAVKWIQSVSGETEITNHSNNQAIVEKIQKILQTPPSEKKCKQPSINNHLLSRINKLWGNFWQGFFNFTKESWLRFKARFFLFKPSEKTLKKSSEMAAISQYFAAKEKVPAYRQFLDNKVQKPNRFSEIPITSKDNYIKPSIASHDHGLGLYKGGLIPTGSKNDTSTGTTGEPTQWYRGAEEQRSAEQLSSYAAKAILGDQPYYFINGFALGQWASGLTAFSAARNDPNATLSSPGSDVNKIFKAIKQAIAVMPEGYPIVVAGYPPHLREIVDLAIHEKFDLSRHNIIGVVGGEGISEGQRDLIVFQKDDKGNVTRQGFSRCYSAYGASDLDINIGYESEFEIELRKLCHTNSKLSAELFDGNGSIPMIFHYDPLNYHIETNEEEELIFTCTRNDRISPRIRYDLGDKGKVMACSDLIATLKKHGITPTHMPRTELPFVFVWGRGDNMIFYRGANVAPENLGEAIRRAQLNEAIAHYAFFQYEEDKKTITEFLIEPKEGENLPPDLLQTLVNQMKEINPDFKKQYEECGDSAAKPRLRLFEPGTSPMAAQRTRNPHAKKKYIFIEKENDEFTPSHLALGGQLIKEASFK